jgi:hypothetical protein
VLLKIKEYFWKDYNPIYEGNRSSRIVAGFKRRLEKHYRDLSTGIIDRAYRVVQDYAGVPVTTAHYNGTIHDFGLLNTLAEIPQTKSLFIQAAAELKKYLLSE